ncbi:hypothetical protein CR513_43546, partial [Mucuna pruriens]
MSTKNMNCMASGSINIAESTQDNWKSSKNELVGSGYQLKEKSAAGIAKNCANFVVVSYPHIARTLSQHRMDQLYKLHGALVEIISDRDPVFVSKFWKEFLKTLRIEHISSSSYYPFEKFKTLEGKGPLLWEEY